MSKYLESMARIVSKREAYDYEATFVCVECAISDRAFIQPRCPRCYKLMKKVDK